MQWYLDLYILSQRSIWNLQHRFHNILKNYKKNSYNLCKFYIQTKKIDYNKYNQKHQEISMERSA